MSEPLPTGTLLELHRTMVRIRVFEERVQELFSARKLPGFVHVYLGEEAVAAGVCAVLRSGDYITSTHRGHGHAIAKGVGLDRLMAELYGKETGVCRGRGGSMHVADFALGMLGANGIVAAGCGLATGAALSARYRDSSQVAVCFFGDGGINKGTFHEAANFAAVKQLPVVFVCENNRFAQYTAFERTTAITDLAQRANGYGMHGATVDGNDVVAVFETARAAIARARDGDGPSLLNMETYRYGGHFVGDAEEYRTKDDVAGWRERDPILRLEQHLVDTAQSEKRTLEAVWTEVSGEVGEAERFAEESPYPDPGSALDGVFTR
jgi:acetoin:2,6-dichlorophenolindophenol oxidoreductase subunit alpha